MWPGESVTVVLPGNGLNSLDDIQYSRRILKGHLENKRRQRCVPR